MRRRILLAKLAIVVVALSLLTGTVVAYAAERTATVGLHSFEPSGLSSEESTIGTITVVSTTGPAGGTSVSITLHKTEVEHNYVLYLGRDGRSYRVLDIVAWISGTGGQVTIDGIQMEKAPTNGLQFELVDLSTNQIVAISDPIKY